MDVGGVRPCGPRMMPALCLSCGAGTCPAFVIAAIGELHCVPYAQFWESGSQRTGRATVRPGDQRALPILGALQEQCRKGRS